MTVEPSLVVRVEMWCGSPSASLTASASKPSQTKAADRFDLSRWRLAGNGADMIRPDVMQSFVDAFADAGFSPKAFLPSYGLAEATLAVTIMPPGEGIIVDAKGQRHNWSEELARKLIALQHDEGYWVNTNKAEMQDNKVLVTSFTLMAMQAVLQ